MSISGISGDMCAPTCSAHIACPTDVPMGVTATPMCTLKGPQKSYCALICTDFEVERVDQQSTECGSGASCQMIDPGIGVCIYD